MTNVETEVSGQQLVDRAARQHGWISNGDGGNDASHFREFAYRLPGTPAYVSAAYAFDGTLLWADGQGVMRERCHFCEIDKVDRLVSFMAGN